MPRKGVRQHVEGSGYRGPGQEGIGEAQGHHALVVLLEQFDVGGDGLDGLGEGLERIRQFAGGETPHGPQVVAAGDEQVERRHRGERVQGREGPRQVLADDPVGGIVQEGVVLVLPHELALHELELAVHVDPVTRPHGHAVAEDEMGGRIGRHGTMDGVRLELQGGFLEEKLRFLGVLEQFLLGDAPQVGQQVTDRHDQRDPVRLLELHGVADALRPICPDRSRCDVLLRHSPVLLHVLVYRSLR